MQKELEQILLEQKIREMLMGAKVVYIDLDFTLWGHDQKKEIPAMCQELGIPNSAIVKSQFYHMCKYFSYFLAGKRVSEREVAKCIEFYMPILRVFHISGKKFLKAWCKVDHTIHYPEALLLVKMLTEDLGLEVYAISDWFKEVQQILIERHGFLPYLKKIYCFDGYFMKNDPRTVKNLPKKVIRQEEAMMIGDSRHCDGGFAENAGFKFILISKKPEDKNYSYRVPTCVVPDISVITTALKGFH